MQRSARPVLVDAFSLLNKSGKEMEGEVFVHRDSATKGKQKITNILLDFQILEDGEELSCQTAAGWDGWCIYSSLSM